MFRSFPKILILIFLLALILRLLYFPGNLKIETNRSNLPKIRFTIMEPTVGIGDKQKEDFFKEENYFTKVVEERQFGTIKVQLRKPY